MFTITKKRILLFYPQQHRINKIVTICRMNNNVEVGKCIKVGGEDAHGHYVYSIYKKEEDNTYRRWSVKKREWESTTRKLENLDDFDVLSKCPGESKGGARKRTTRRKKSGTKRRHH